MNAAAQILAFPTPNDWSETCTGKRIIGALSFAQVTSDLALIYGTSGVGKTRAAVEYSRRGANIWLATITPATSGIVPALGEVCTAIGIAGCNGAAALHSAIVQRIKGTDGLLIIDEAQQLSAAALDQLRSIYDAAGVGMALIGTPDLYTRLTAGEDSTILDRLLSRVGKRLYLDAVAVEDVQAIAAAWGIQNGRAQKTLQDIAHKPGALRLISKTLRLARLAADNRAITDADLRDAWGELGGN